ncbi:MAG: hypothetical protein V4638_11265 [Bacteroidota bacterium]
MHDKEKILKAFINNFILQNSQERSFVELSNAKKRGKFTNRLNHKWDSILKMQHLTKIDKTTDNQEDIQKKLKIKDDELVYIISNYDEVDDRIISFKDVFPVIYSRGLGTILINTNGDKIFLDTEQDQGPADRFIGEIKVAKN